jgi:transposase
VLGLTTWTLCVIGWNMERFPCVGHLIRWAELCPRMDESASQKRNTRIKKGAPWLKITLVQAAWAVVGTKGSYFGSLYHSIKSRAGRSIPGWSRQEPHRRSHHQLHS